MQLYDSSEYRASTLWPYAISAGCVVYKRHGDALQVLVLERRAGHENDPKQTVTTYMLPKGHVELNEPLETAAVREAEEEAGCKVVIQTYLGANIHEFVHPKHGMLNIKTTHYFAAQWQTDSAEMDQEHDGRVWVDASQAIALLSAPETKRGEAQFIVNLQKFLELQDNV